MATSSDQDNNFDFLRLVTALGVVVSHQYAVAGLPSPSLNGFIYLGTSGVLVFFAISGYLVTGSWRNDPHLFRFMARRLLRMWPGLAMMTLLVVLVLGACVTTDSLASYYSSPATWKYFSVLGLWKFEEPLPGVFLDNPAGRSVNASLWSIPIEVRCYVALAFAGLLALLRRPWTFLLAAAAYAAALYLLFAQELNAGLYRLYWQLAIVFLIGTALYQGRALWQLRRWTLGVFVLLAGYLLWRNGQREGAYLLCLGVGAVLFGTARTPVLHRAGRFGDLSYGTYIYGFPVQQTLVWATDNQLSVHNSLAITTVITLALAWMSWHWVEAPALRLKIWIGRGRRYAITAAEQQIRAARWTRR